MNKIVSKLKSQRGASLSYALLLFMVCAVVGSIVLAAGTAAAGRASRLAKSDQRYYSVTSAARLLSEALGTEVGPFTFTKETVSKTTSKYKRENGIVVSVSENTPPSIDKPKYTPGTLDLDTSVADVAVQTITKKFLFGSYTDMSVAWDTIGKPAKDYELPEMTLTLGASGKTLTGLTVSITGKIYKDGTIVLILANKVNEGDKDKNQYKLQLTLSCQANIEESSNTVTAPLQVTSGDGVNYTETLTETKTETKTVTLSWKATELKTLETSA